MKGTGDQSLIISAELVRQNNQAEVTRSLIFQFPTEYNVILEMCTRTEQSISPQPDGILYTQKYY
jgi:hypothetical protein